MIELKHLSKSFSGRCILEDISLKIDKGSIVTLFGPTGCGKSTLLEMMAGLQLPTSGEAIVPKRDKAMVFQDYAVFPWMTVLKNVTFTLSIVGVPRDQRKGIALDYLRKVGLSDALNKYPSQLSGGMKQRLALARALAVKPRIIFMDEPFASVDAQTREQLQDLLLDIWSSNPVTIIMVTHDIEEATYLSDKIVLFSASPSSRVTDIIEVNAPRPRRRDAQSFG